MRARRGFRSQGGGEELTSWLLGNLGGPASPAMRVAIACDVALASFDTKRSGTDVRLNELRRRHRRVRDSLPSLALLPAADAAK